MTHQFLAVPRSLAATVAVVGLSLTLMGCGSGSNNNNGAATGAKLPADTTTAANTDSCSLQLLDDTAPKVPNALAKQSYPLCFKGFKVLYSGISRTPIWVAEYLTKQRLADARKLPREGNFHEETQLPVAVRSRLADYSNSGYDRGHLAPNADMQNDGQQVDSFTLANIAPQTPDHNRKTWAKVEGKTRDLTEKYGSSYVVTGTAFLTTKVKKINNRVLVPSHFFKGVYLPTQQQAVVFFSPNNTSNQVETLSVNQLQQRTGIDVFPSLPAAVKNSVLPVTLN